ncbi:hypothetical protein MAHJHV47_44190 [Mycobacterium avium subsp. hominissuis]
MFLSVVILGRFTTETHAMALLRQGPTRRHHLHHSPGRSPELRRDIDRAQFLITRLRHRFPEVDVYAPTTAADGTEGEVPITEAARSDNARNRAPNSSTSSDVRRVIAG